VAAGQLFRAIGMDSVADAPPMTEEELAAYQRVGRAWVATESPGVAIAYILVDLLGVWAHIEQVTVHPDQGRRGIGSTLITHVERWAAGTNLRGLSLTTFTSVPWNAPYYERLGFRQLPRTEWTNEHVEVVRREKQHGLDAWPRTVMVREVRASRPGLNSSVPEGTQGSRRDGTVTRRRTLWAEEASTQRLSGAVMAA
jgi:GNAT superfamily N-acetyltransferase